MARTRKNPKADTKEGAENAEDVHISDANKIPLGSFHGQEDSDDEAPAEVSFAASARAHVETRNAAPSARSRRKRNRKRSGELEADQADDKNTEAPVEARIDASVLEDMNEEIEFNGDEDFEQADEGEEEPTSHIRFDSGPKPTSRIIEDTNIEVCLANPLRKGELRAAPIPRSTVQYRKSRLHGGAHKRINARMLLSRKGRAMRPALGFVREKSV